MLWIQSRIAFCQYAFCSLVLLFPFWKEVDRWANIENQNLASLSDHIGSTDEKSTGPQQIDQQASKPDIFHSFYTTALWGLTKLHSKVRKCTKNDKNDMFCIHLEFFTPSWFFLQQGYMNEISWSIYVPLLSEGFRLS